METVLALQLFLFGDNTVISIAKLVLMSVWLLVFVDLFRSRNEPKANHALCATLAVLLAELLFIVNIAISPFVMIFFLLLAKLVLGVSYVRMMNGDKAPGSRKMLARMSCKNIAECGEGSIKEKFSRAVLAYLVAGIAYSQVYFLFG